MTTERFVMLHPDRLDDVCVRHELVGVDRHVLIELLLVANHLDDTARLTATELARHIGIARKTLMGALQRLSNAKTVEFEFPRGSTGWVRVSVYAEIMRLSTKAQDQRRASGLRPAEGKGAPGGDRVNFASIDARVAACPSRQSTRTARSDLRDGRIDRREPPADTRPPICSEEEEHQSRPDDAQPLAPARWESMRCRDCDGLLPCASRYGAPDDEEWCACDF